jgi:hypothetical protein
MTDVPRGVERVALPAFHTNAGTRARSIRPRFSARAKRECRLRRSGLMRPQSRRPPLRAWPAAGRHRAHGARGRRLREPSGGATLALPPFRFANPPQLRRPAIRGPEPSRIGEQQEVLAAISAPILAPDPLAVRRDTPAGDDRAAQAVRALVLVRFGQGRVVPEHGGCARWISRRSRHWVLQWTHWGEQIAFPS